MTERRQPSPAEIYESYLVPGIHARWTPVFLDHAQPQTGEHVLDVACGTGIVARHVAPRVGPAGRVVGIDISPDMLAVARERSPPTGAGIEWREADAASLPDGPFDLVLCQQGLQFFPDGGVVAGEMRRALSSGGRATVSVWHGLESHPLYQALIKAEARYLGTSVDMLASPFLFGDADKLRNLMTGAGFERVEITPETHTVRFPSPDRFVTLTLLAAAAFIPESEMDAGARSTMVESISRESRDTLQAYVDGDTVSFPMHANIAVAYA